MSHPPSHAPRQAGDPTPETGPEAGPLADALITAVERGVTGESPPALPRATEIAAVGLPVSALSQLIRAVAATVPDAELPPAAAPALGDGTVRRLADVSDAASISNDATPANPSIPTAGSGLTSHHPIHLRVLGTKAQVHGAISRFSVAAAAPATLRAFTDYPPRGPPFGQSSGGFSRQSSRREQATDDEAESAGTVPGAISGDGGATLARYATPPGEQMAQAADGSAILPNFRIASQPDGEVLEPPAAMAAGTTPEALNAESHNVDAGEAEWPPRGVAHPPLVFAGDAAFTVVPSPAGWWEAVPVAVGDRAGSLYARYLAPWSDSEPVRSRTPPYNRAISAAAEEINLEFAQTLHRALGCITVSSRAVLARGRSSATPPTRPEQLLKPEEVIVLAGCVVGTELIRLTQIFEQVGVVSGATISRAKGRLIEQTELVGEVEVPQDIGRPRLRLVRGSEAHGRSLDAILHRAAAALH
jgi:hypothetical protein